MKKITALLLALLMLVGALAGCGKQNDTNKTDKLSIVTTIFPEYDWVRATYSSMWAASPTAGWTML